MEIRWYLLEYLLLYRCLWKKKNRIVAYVTRQINTSTWFLTQFKSSVNQPYWWYRGDRFMSPLSSVSRMKWKKSRATTEIFEILREDRTKLLLKRNYLLLRGKYNTEKKIQNKRKILKMNGGNCYSKMRILVCSPPTALLWDNEQKKLDFLKNLPDF